MRLVDSITERARRLKGRLQSPPPRFETGPEPDLQTHWTFDQDGLKTAHNCDFLKDARFQESYQLGKSTGSWGDYELAWRAYVVCWAAAKGRDLDGDYVECGVNKGGYARAVMQYIDFANLPNKKFYLVDTYNGIPDEFLNDQTRPLLKNSYSECYAETARTFACFENAVLVRGVVPNILPQVKAEKVCYLSIDMNAALPEIAAAEFFWDKMSSGAVMVLDDYGFNVFIQQKHAFDAFAHARNVDVLSLPTGQGLIFKP